MNDCTLACKIRNQMYTKFKKRNIFHRLLAVLLLKNGCSIRNLFCKIFIPLYEPKFYWTAIFISYFTPNFLTKYFLGLLFLAADWKINVMYLRKLNLTIDSGRRLEITRWKYCLYEQFFKDLTILKVPTNFSEK